MGNIFFDKFKVGVEYMNEGIKVIKDEALHQMSKKVSWLDSPYKNTKKEQTSLEKNIALSSLVENGEKNIFEDRRII